jgi:hypothetical protein
MAFLGLCDFDPGAAFEGFLGTHPRVWPGFEQGM